MAADTLVWYPTVEDVIEYNQLVLDAYPVKRQDAHQVLSYEKLGQIVQKVTLGVGPTYTQAAVLLEELIKAHAFASGNRRTAFLATKEYLSQNDLPCRVPNTAVNARVLLGIRENFYSRADLVRWLKTGTIHPFTRTP